jgi:hypothetical protein
MQSCARASSDRRLPGTPQARRFGLLCLATILLDAATAASAPAQVEPSAGRCAQLVAYYDRYGPGSTNSDGRRNHTRMVATITCHNGQFAKGIATIEKQLRNKKFTVQPPGPDEPERDS